MRQRLEFWSSKWWRFSRYEIHDGAIRPAGNGSLEQYDPWDLYRISGLDAETPSPYISLVQLLLSLGALVEDTVLDFGVTVSAWKLAKRLEDGSLTPSDQDEILRWCSRFGLLGILPHAALSIEMPLTHAVRDENWHKCETGFRTVPMKHARTNGEWVVGLQELTESKLRERVPSVFLRSSLFDPGEDFAGRMPAMRIPDFIALSKIQIGPFEAFPVATLLPMFFPEFIAEGNDFVCPLPLSPEFWRIYSERVDDFLNCAVTFLNAVEPISSRRAWADLAKLQDLLEPTGTALSFDSEQHIQEQWVCPSLLSAFARMALQDMSSGMRILRCDCCGGPFATSAYQARFCTTKCAWKYRKRKARDKKGTQSTTGTPATKESRNL